MKLRFEQRVTLLGLLAGLPGLVCALLLLWVRPEWITTRPVVVTAVLLIVWFVIAERVRRHITFPLQTVSNVVAALREGDFSVRGRQSHALRPNDTLEELIREINELARTLHTQRLGAVEAVALLGKVMEEIDVAVFAFDAAHRLKLSNRSGLSLLDVAQEDALGKTAEELGLAEYLVEEGPRLVEASFAGKAGRWEIRHSTFRQEGLPHRLLVLSDLTRTLREEELQAWQRMVRVIGHEINNSLTPIMSISGSLQSGIARRERPPDWEEDLTHGLGIIGARAESLGRFIAAYTRLARLPQPRLQQVDIGALVRRAVAMETRIPVSVSAGESCILPADPDQIEQVLINLIRNAADATLEAGAAEAGGTEAAGTEIEGRAKGKVTISWSKMPTHVELRIDDEGPGLSNTSNLFVPFFTTKPGGSGIGLVLSRQIAEAHGGSLRLDNRTNSHGCTASLRLPIQPLKARADR